MIHWCFAKYLPFSQVSCQNRYLDCPSCSAHLLLLGVDADAHPLPLLQPSLLSPTVPFSPQCNSHLSPFSLSFSHSKTKKGIIGKFDENFRSYSIESKPPSPWKEPWPAVSTGRCSYFSLKLFSTFQTNLKYYSLPNFFHFSPHRSEKLSGSGKPLLTKCSQIAFLPLPSHTSTK